jgi:hypothetical protein
MPPRWGPNGAFVFGRPGYKYFAPPELRNGGLAKTRTAALIQQQRTSARWAREDGPRLLKNQDSREPSLGRTRREISGRRDEGGNEFAIFSAPNPYFTIMTPGGQAAGRGMVIQSMHPILVP